MSVYWSLIFAFQEGYMKKALLTLLLTAALFAPAFAQLTEEEQAFIQKCYDNIDKDKKQLSPDTAKECITKLNVPTPALLNKLRNENPAVATDIVAYNNALIDLKNIVARNSGKSLACSLSRVLDTVTCNQPDQPASNSCALCDLDLGPRPERVFDWVGKNASGRLFDVQKSVKTWEVLGEIRINSLSRAEYGYSKDKWNDQAILKRFTSLTDWAKKETDSLVNFAAMPEKAAGSSAWVSQMAGTLKENLTAPEDQPYRDKLDKLLKDSAKSGDSPVSPPKPGADDKKAKEMAAASDRLSALKGGPAMDRQGYLDKAFDNTDAKNGLVVAPPAGAAGNLAAGSKGGFTPVPMTDSQAKELSSKMAAMKDGKFTGYLADELKGTKAGDEMNSFFNDQKYAKTGLNGLNLKFEKGKEADGTANALGWWYTPDKTTRVNTNLVDQYCEKNKITPTQLLASDAHLKGVATYVAPNFVHETAHQRQAAWSKANGLDFIKYARSSDAPYQMEMETEAFSMQAAFSAEKSKKLGPEYLDKINWSHAANADKFLQKGVDALRTEKSPLYPGINSMEGSAAKELKQAQFASKRLGELEKQNRTNPSSMTAADKKYLAQYKEVMDTRFKWYTMVYQKSAADEAKLMAWRDSFDESDKPLASPVPGM